MSKKTTVTTYAVVTVGSYAITAPGALTVNEGVTLAPGGADTTLDNTGGSFVNYGILQIEGDEVLTAFMNDVSHNGMVKYTGAGSYSGLRAGSNYYNVTFDAVGGWTLTSALDVDGSIVITNGALQANGMAITVAGNWSNSGTFTHGSSTVTFDGSGSSEISGSTQFHNLTIETAGKTARFQNGRTQAVNGLLYLKGASGNYVSFSSASQGSQWYINSIGAANVSYTCHFTH